MQVQNIAHMFSFTFQKPTSVLVVACQHKASALRSKIEEREGRVAKIRAEYKITDAVLIDLLSQARAASKRNDALMNYSSSVQPNDSGEPQIVTVGAGVVNMLLTEQDFISGERAQVDKLDLIARNLTDYVDDRGNVRSSHNVSYDELRFLGL